MRLTNLESEQELLQMESDFHKGSVKARLKSIRKTNAKKRVCKIRYWLKDHLN
jgi:hypothetical protein